MIKSFIEHIQKTAQPVLKEIGGATFALWPNGEASELTHDPALDYPKTLPLTSLDALAQMVKSEAIQQIQGVSYITVPDHLHVKFFTQPDHENPGFRPVLYEAKAVDVPGWEEKTTLSFEEMQIALRTRFQDQDSGDMVYTMRLLSEISTGAKITFNDNGIATSVVTKKGVDLQSNELIRPIVTLRPYRTFQEVRQPESVFLIRVSERGISLISADGGMWKLHARETVKAHLQTLLAQEIEEGRVIVAL